MRSDADINTFDLQGSDLLHGNEFEQQTRNSHARNRAIVARRAAAPAASLNWWRGRFRIAKRRRYSGSVSKSASIKILTVSSLQEIPMRAGASPKSTSWRRPFVPRMMAYGVTVSLGRALPSTGAVALRE
jgi:hypothetical protein